MVFWRSDPVQILQRHHVTIQKLRAVNNFAAASVVPAAAAAGVENPDHPALPDHGLDEAGSKLVGRP
jgi:hypothetical protein